MGKAKLNAKAMHTLFCGLNDDVSKNVSSCKSAKEMWEKLEKLYKKEEMKCAKVIWKGIVRNMKEEDVANWMKSDSFRQFPRLYRLARIKATVALDLAKDNHFRHGNWEDVFFLESF
ncbi:hypothetical protein GQ457_03G001080 [Hibiscus cannabinus]